jgi:hypothetical protein
MKIQYPYLDFVVCHFHVHSEVFIELHVSDACVHLQVQCVCVVIVSSNKYAHLDIALQNRLWEIHAWTVAKRTVSKFA